MNPIDPFTALILAAAGLLPPASAAPGGPARRR